MYSFPLVSTCSSGRVFAVHSAVCAKRPSPRERYHSHSFLHYSSYSNFFSPALHSFSSFFPPFTFPISLLAPRFYLAAVEKSHGCKKKSASSLSLHWFPITPCIHSTGPLAFHLFNDSALLLHVLSSSLFPSGNAASPLHANKQKQKESRKAKVNTQVMLLHCITPTAWIKRT